MSNNNWETQPRLKNGEFTFRNKPDFMHRIFQKALEDAKSVEIRKRTRGGSYGFLRNFTTGNKGYEIHHMPAASVSPLTRWRGPCIIMSKDDHKKTGSFGKSHKAIRYRRWQAKLISEGSFFEAEYMDIKNIQRSFGDRYDTAIAEKIIYEKKLISEGFING